MKQRHNPDKPQNNYGGDYCCKNYDTYTDKDGIRREFCHDETMSIEWVNMENGKLECKGNRHVCKKMKLRWLASLSDKDREYYFEHGRQRAR